MHAFFEYHEYMKAQSSHVVKQYTIRNIPLLVDQYLRQRAKATGSSFNQVVLDALMRGTDEKVARRTDFDFLIGSMTQDEANAIESTVQATRTVDKELWEK